MLVIFLNDTYLGELVPEYIRVPHRHEFEPGKLNVAKVDEAMYEAKPEFAYFKGNTAPISRQLSNDSKF